MSEPTVTIGGRPPVPIVLIHGGGLDARCWDMLTPHLEGPVLAIDLPGRGSRTARTASFHQCADVVDAEVVAAGFDYVVLVGHSLAGCSMPAICAKLGERVRHAVFVGCCVPEHGSCALDTLDPAVRRVVDAAEDALGDVMPPELAAIVLGDDLTAEQLQWCIDRLVPELPDYHRRPVDLTPFGAAFPRTWVRTMRDVALPPEQQSRFALNVERCEVVDLDAGHMCMVSQPRALADILNELAAERR